jgi:hypothetical protein
MSPDIQNEICITQQDLYEHAALHQYNMPVFSDMYLQSDFCRRAMDTIYSRFQLADPLEILDFLLPEIGPEDKLKYQDGEWFNRDVAAWIGFMYRLLYFKTGISSKELSQKVTFGGLCAAYPGLHTIDEDQAADILIEEKKLCVALTHASV